MKRAAVILCIVGIFVILLSECFFRSDNKAVHYPAENVITSNEDIVTKQTSIKKEIIINTVHVTEQPLSEINTEESDLFAINYNNSYHS